MPPRHLPSHPATTEVPDTDLTPENRTDAELENLCMDLPPILYQVLCEFSGCPGLLDELPRGQVPECRVWSLLVVLLSPGLDPLPRVGHRQEPAGVQRGTIAGASRVWQSTTLSMRKRLPLKSASETKSIAQTSFGAPAAGRASR